MAILSNEEILAFIELADKATPGPWYNSEYNRNIRNFAYEKEYNLKPFHIARYPSRTHDYPISHEMHDCNAKFIAASRTIAPELAKEVLLLREKLSVAVEALENISSWECNECMKASSAEESLKKIRGE